MIQHNETKAGFLRKYLYIYNETKLIDMLANNQYINLLLSAFFVVMLVFMLVAKKAVHNLELKQQELTTVVLE